jgi:hypothetical protein
LGSVQDGMRKVVSVGLAALALLLAACGTQEQTVGGAGTSTTDSPPLTEPDPAPLYEANAMVLEAGDRGPILCLGAVLTSLPPQCGDVPLAGWDWRSVKGEETAGDTTWGSYHVVGRYDGDSFAVTTVGPYEDDPSSFGTDPDLSSPCPEPDGGWSGLDHATQEDAHSVAAYARSQTDYVTSWVTQLKPAKAEFGPVVVNVLFTGDRERHEADIRKFWGGPLCVVTRDVPTARELAQVRKEAEASLPELGLQMLWSSGPDVEPVIEIGVVADPGGQGQAAFDARFGPGLVRVIPALRPVS